MLWGLYTLGFNREADDFFYFLTDACAADPEMQVMYGIGGDGSRGADPRPPLRLRRRPSGADRQRRLQPAPERHLRRTLDAAYLHTRARGRLSGRVWDVLRNQVEMALEVARAGPRISSRRAAPFHLLEADVLGGGRPRGPTRDPASAPNPRRGRRDPGRHLRQRGRQRPQRVHPALRDQGARCLPALDVAGPVLPPRTCESATPFSRLPTS